MTNDSYDFPDQSEQAASSVAVPKAGERAEEEAWLRVMDTRDGAIVLRSILRETKPYCTTYTRGDAAETAYREGKRAVGLWLMSKMGEVDAALAVNIVHFQEFKEQR